MNGQLRTGSFNWAMLGTTVVVAGLGVVNLYSASQGAETNLALLQLLWLGIGLVLSLVFTALDYRIFERLAYPLLGLSLLLLLSVFFTGRVVRGSQRWIHFGWFNIQPSEVAKIALILALSKYFNHEPELPAGGYTLRDLIKPATPLYPVGGGLALILFWERLPLGGWRFVLEGVCVLWAVGSVLFALRTGRTGLHDLLSPVILSSLPILLIMRQPDLGTTLVLVAIAGTMILFAKVRLLSLLLAAVVLAAASAGAYYFLLKPYQQQRIITFVSPGADSKDTGYHSKQSIIAVGSGGASGKGFGESTQTQFKFLPEQNTDFVFSVWAEEWGFTGCLGVLGLFLFWFLQMVNVASSARERFGIFIGVGMTALVFWHTAINIGMVIGMLPVVGITLPLWSYGGSSVLVIMAGVGLLLSIYMRRHTF